MSRVVVIGGGPAGMSAAIAAAENGHHVTLLEKNEKLGKKLFITGKGRCNITNSSDMDVLFNSVMTNRKFLYSAFYAYDNQMVIDFFEQAGLPFNLSMHVARHSFAVFALNKGLSMTVVSRLLGHGSTDVTEKVYARFLPETLSTEVARLKDEFKTLEII